MHAPIYHKLGDMSYSGDEQFTVHILQSMFRLAARDLEPTPSVAYFILPPLRRFAGGYARSANAADRRRTPRG
jgi:hypothetical protein